MRFFIYVQTLDAVAGVTPSHYLHGEEIYHSNHNILDVLKRYECNKFHNFPRH